MKTVLTVGVFDYFHLGHLRLFKQAKTNVCSDVGGGVRLIVAVQDGAYILKYKPDTRILYSTEERMELIEALKIVDEVTVYRDVDEFVKGLDFDIFAVGEDQNHAGFLRAIRWCEEHGKQVIRLKRTPGICSSGIKTAVNP